MLITSTYNQDSKTEKCWFESSNIFYSEFLYTYNPFHYIRDDFGVMMLINCLIKNTNIVKVDNGG